MATVTFYSSTYAIANNPRTCTGVSWAANSLLVVIPTSENSDTDFQNLPTATGVAFTQPVTNTVVSNECTRAGFVGVASSALSSQTVSLTATGAAPNSSAWGVNLWVITPDSGYTLGVGNVFSNLNESNTSLTVQASSTVCYVLGDWSENSTTQTLATGSGTSDKRLDSSIAGRFAYVVGDWKNVSAGSFSFGITSFTGITVAAQVAIEIRETALVDPYIVSMTETAISTAGTSHAITLPGSIQTTDMTLLIADIGSTAATVNSLTDWTEILDENTANGLKVLIYTGASTPSNPTFTLSASTRGVWFAFRIAGADKSVTPQIGTTATGTSVSPNPPSVTPSGGTRNYLVIPFFGMAGEEADDDTWVNSGPSGYLPTIPYQKSGGTAGTNLGGLLGASYLNINTGSAIDPGTFNCDVSAAWRAQTVVIHQLLVSTGHPVKLKVSGTFTTYPLKLKAGGTFVEYPTKLKASGVFTP